ncbi:iron complex outermembrane receptor protein [Dyadobacter jejuensis]|uniref:Iron complex outermembrane receptor protein n=1 Tax=Dyadobacter jejuensis TaxID=1082580 RepID=A0A316ASK2_9BACT|nr:TonB-dependent siderophore receptor [Dyadobacter jejuensis]PWJ60498.1 iron complex outermembrane receptor protein [Dyadobacter jejuensis]
MRPILIIFFCLNTLLLKAQIISGNVSDAHTGAGIQGASVILLDSQTGTVTDSTGDFSIEGKGTIEVSILGYKKTKINPTNQFLKIALISETNQLQTVEVLGRVARDYNSEYSFSATRISTLNKDIPQSISTITKELMADRQAFHLGDAVKIASGVIPSSFYNQYTIRGISQNEEGQIINGMRTRQYYFLQPLTTNIERVEVIKGPASATFSSVDPGGSINLVTKKPLAVNRNEVTLSAGSFSTFRGTMDFTGPLNESKTLLYRLNGAYQEARSFRDLVSSKSLLISPSISYLPSDKTAINAELIYSNDTGNLDRGQPIFGAVSGKTDLSSTPKSLNLGATNDFFKSKQLIMMGNITHKFNSLISFNASYMKQSWTEDLQEHRTTNAFAPDITNQPVTSLAAMQFVQRQQYWSIDNLNAYFNLNFNTGSAGHKLLVGYDLSSWQKLRGGGQNAARGFLLKDGTVAASFVAANAADYQTITVGEKTLPRPNVNYFDLQNPQYTIRNVDDYSLNLRSALPPALTTTNAIYVQEQLQYNKFTLLLSLRNEWFEDITNYQAPGTLTVKKTALLPRIGLTYAISKAANIYGTYLEGFQPQSNTVTLMPQTGSLPAGSQFDPLTSNLKEVGLKTDLFENRIHMNVAVYEIKQKNILMNANDPDNPDLLVTRGGERSRGVEWDIAGYITPNWQINASFSYIDAIITHDADESLIGARKQNTPKQSANLWTRYNFGNSSPLKDLGLGFGLQYQGNKLPWFDRTFTIPAFTVFDAALYYNPGRSNMQIAVNAGNLFNKNYWLGAQNYLRLFPGAPRNGMITLTYKF